MVRTPQQRTQISRDREHADAGPRTSYQQLVDALDATPDMPMQTVWVKEQAVLFAQPILSAFAVALRNCDALEAIAAVAKAAEWIDTDGVPVSPVVPQLVASFADQRRYILLIERDIREGLFSQKIERHREAVGSAIDQYRPETPPVFVDGAPSVPRLNPLDAPMTAPGLPEDLFAAMTAHDAAREAQAAAENTHSDLARRYRDGDRVVRVAHVQAAEAAAIEAKRCRLEMRAQIDQPHREHRARVSAAVADALNALSGELRTGRANAIVGADMITVLHRACMRHGVLWATRRYGGAVALTASTALVDTLMTGRSPRQDNISNQMASAELLRLETAEAEHSRLSKLRADQRAIVDDRVDAVRSEQWAAAARKGAVPFARRSEFFDGGDA